MCRVDFTDHDSFTPPPGDVGGLGVRLFPPSRGGKDMGRNALGVRPVAAPVDRLLIGDVEDQPPTDRLTRRLPPMRGPTNAGTRGG